MTGDRATLGVALVATAAAVTVAVLAAALSPLLPIAALLGAGTAAAIFRRPILGLFLFIGVVAVLPFGVIPIPLGGAQLTFVDAVLLTTYAAVLARVVFDRWRLVIGAPGTALILFVLVAVVAFMVGAASSSVPPELIRRFGKLVVSLLFFLVARAVLTNEQRLTWLTRGLMIAGAVQGAIGAALMALAPLTQLTLLTRLQAIGYPGTDVLRYVPGPNNTYTQQLRAIGTSVDPNVFGGTLMLALAVIVVQWAAPRPVLPKLVLAALALPTAGGVLLSLSRASWLGLSCGLLLIGAWRYRRILVLGGFAAAALLVTSTGRDFLVRFVSGFSTADQATAFRVGEYGNALTLLQRYPLLGIGFGASPDIDVTAGVSSVYLLVAEQTGLLGLILFVVALLLVWLAAVRNLDHASDLRLQGIRAGLLAALTAALVAGFLDHYFANQAFPHAVALFWLYAGGLTAASEIAPTVDRRRVAHRGARTWSHVRGAERAPV